METFHYFAGDRLSTAELTAACLDGDLRDIGDGFVPADTVETTWMRARSLLPVLGTSLAATRATAAWVYGALSDLPGRLDVQRACTRRRHHIPQRRLAYSDVHLPERDGTVIAGVTVTTLARTAADLARGDDATVLDAFLAWRPEACVEGLAWLDENSGFPGTRTARSRLAAALSRL